MSRKGLILFLVFLIMAPIAINVVIGKLVAHDPNHNLLEKARQTPPPFLAIGTSRSAADLDQEAFDKKLVIVSVPFLEITMMDLIVAKHSEILKHAGQVYLEFYPEMFYLRKMSNEPETRRNLDALEIPTWDFQSVWNQPSKWQVETFFPFLTRLRVTPKEVLFPSGVRDIILKSQADVEKNNGSLPRPLAAKPEQLEETSKSMVSVIQKFQDPKTEEEGIAQFRALDARLRTMGIHYCWLELPQHPAFREANLESNSRLRSAVADILKEKVCLPNEQIVEMSTHLPFQDPNHLQRDGAVEFSKVLRAAHTP